MRFVITAILFYFLFNFSVWLSLATGGLLALAVANWNGAVITGLRFRNQLKGRPQWGIALFGSLGIEAIALGLRGAHGSMPISLSMDAIYSGFAVLSWPMFMLLHLAWRRAFPEKPTWVDLACHLAMGGLVYLRFVTYGDDTLNSTGLMCVGLAILGYMTFNTSIKLAKGHRPTNIAMNVGGGLLLMGTGLADHGLRLTFDPNLILGAVLGGIAIFGIVKSMGESYTYFTRLGHPSVVVPLVYDGIIIGSPLLDLIKGHETAGKSVALATGMLVITFLRFRYHMRRKT